MNPMASYRPGADGPADRWLFHAVLLLLFLAPLPLGSNRLPAMWCLVLSVWVLGVLTVWTWRSHAALALQRLRPLAWPIGLLSALCVWMLLQALPLPAAWLKWLSPQSWSHWSGVGGGFHISMEPTVTLTQAALTWAYALVFVMVCLLLRTRDRLDRFVFLMVCIGVCQALLALLLWSMQARYVLFHTEIVHDVAKGTFVNRNHLAGYLVAHLSIGIGLMLGRLGQRHTPARNWSERVRRWLAFALSSKMRLRLMLVVMVIALVLTRSRMGNSAFFSALLITGLLALVWARRAAPAMVTLIASLVLVDVLVVGTWVGLEKVVDRVQGTEMLIEQGGSEESVEQRQLAATYALDMLRDFALTGTGAGTFYGAYLPYRVPGDGFFGHAHNDFVELATDWGLIGVSLLGILVFMSAWVALHAWRRRHTSLPRGLAFGCLMSILAMGIHSTVDFNLQIPANALLMVVVLALAWSVHSLPSGRHDRRHRHDVDR